ncbi:sensor histidine kinase YycG [bacterium BMS3Abin01]|nr:sensor histidine kinase YycG [bacterium BMS3Abin01]
MMPFTKSLKGRLAVYFAVSIFISLLLSGLLSVGLVQRYLRQKTVADLATQAQTIAGRIESEGLPLRRFTQDLEQVQGVKVIIVPYQDEELSGLPHRGYRGELAELSNRPLPFIDWELLGRGETQTSQVQIPGVEKEAMAAAHAFYVDGQLAGAVIVSKSVSALQPWRPLAGEFLIAALIALAISLLFAVLLARHLSRPLHQITQAAVAVADGDFSKQVTVDSQDEIGRLADAFRFMTGEVQKSQQQQRQFVINVSHELKTPLTAITGHVQALRDGVVEGPEAVGRSLEVISTETDRLNRLIEDLLSLAKFDARQFELRNSSFSLDEVLAAVVEGFSREARERQVELGRTGEAGLELTTDQDRLRQILANLVQNALSHTPAGGKVSIEAAGEGDRARITVSDTGAGISSEDLPHVFDRFYRSQGAAREAGLGLGLAISRELAQAMGGDISARSRPGEGSGFTLTLPLSPGG